MQYYESPAYGEWCKRIYGKDLKQMGMVTADELGLFYREVDLAPGSHILDIGCGPGYISAAVAEHFSSRVTGVDIDEGAVVSRGQMLPDDIRRFPPGLSQLLFVSQHGKDQLHDFLLCSNDSAYNSPGQALTSSGLFGNENNRYLDKNAMCLQGKESRVSRPDSNTVKAPYLLLIVYHLAVSF